MFTAGPSHRARTSTGGILVSCCKQLKDKNYPVYQCTLLHADEGLLFFDRFLLLFWLCTGCFWFSYFQFKIYAWYTGNNGHT